MPVPWGLVTFIAGLAYGWWLHDDADTVLRMREAYWWGTVLALLLFFLGYALNSNPMGFAGFRIGEGLVALVIMIAVFVVGSWIGQKFGSPPAEERRDRTA